MAKTPKKLYFNGNSYTDAGRAECPMPGREDCIVATEHEGKFAYWQNGRIYVRDEKPQNSKLLEAVTGWVKKVKGLQA